MARNRNLPKTIDLDDLDLQAIVTEAAATYKRAKVAIKSTHAPYNKEDVRFSTFVMVLQNHIKNIK